MSGVRGYEATADGSDFDELWTEDIAKSQGRITDLGLYPVVAPTYVIFKVSSTYYRRNGDSGIIDDSNVDASTLIQTAIDAIKADTEWRKITFKGGFNIGTAVTCVGATRLCLEGGHWIHEVGATIDHILSISDVAAAESNDVVLKDITFDGNDQGNGHILCIGNLKGGSLLNVNCLNAYRRALNTYRVATGAGNAQYVPENLTVIGGRYTTSTTSAANGSTVLLGGRHQTMINPYIDGGGMANRDGLYLYQNTYGHCFNTTVINPYVYDCGNFGIHAGYDDITLVNPWVNTCVNDGINVISSADAAALAGSIMNVENVTLINPYVTAAEVGIEITNAQNVRVNGGNVVLNDNSGIIVRTGDFGALSPTEDTWASLRDLTVKNNNQVTGSVGVVLSNSEAVELECILDGLRIFDDQGAPTQTRGLQMAGTQDIILKVANANWSGAVYNFSNDNTGTNTRVIAEQDRTGASGDLSAAATNIVCGHFVDSSFLLAAHLIYTAASGVGNETTLKIGKESDDDYYFTGNSEASKAIWYTKTVTLLQNDIAAGDSVLFTWTQNGANTAEIMLVIDYLKGA